LDNQILFLPCPCNKSAAACLFHHFKNFDWEIFSRMVVLSQQFKVFPNCRSTSLASELARRVAAPNVFLVFPVDQDILVTALDEHRSSFRRLSKNQLFLINLAAANHFFVNLALFGTALVACGGCCEIY
jgi:hypothetical protein